MGSGWADLAVMVDGMRTGWAPDPPAGTLAPFTVVGSPGDDAVTRSTAVTVPAYSRGRALIAGACASFPLEEWRDGSRMVPTRQLLAQPDPDTTRSHTLTLTVLDLVDYGRAWWLVLDRDSASDGGRPRAARRIDPADVTIEPDGTVLFAGTPARAGDVIRFDHDPHGALARGRRILSTALALEAAARRYARAPAPRTVLRGTGDAHLDDDDARELLDTYLATVAEKGAAYVDAVELDQVGWSSAELQLVEARQHTAGQIANLLNLDASWLGAAASGSSLTYTNRLDLNRSLVDLTLRGYLDTIEQRLTLDDVTEHGRIVRWNLDGFLRGNATERATLVSTLLPLGVITIDEARRVMDLAPDETVTPGGTS